MFCLLISSQEGKDVTGMVRKPVTKPDAARESKTSVKVASNPTVSAAEAHTSHAEPDPQLANGR